jgi:hypothetical protein
MARAAKTGTDDVERGVALLGNPIRNKGIAFTADERSGVIRFLTP